MAKYFNINSVKEIIVNDFTPSNDYWWQDEQPAKKFLFWEYGYEPAGIYTTTGSLFHPETVCIGTQPPENHILKDNKVLEKPHVKIVFNDNFKIKKHFEHHADCVSFVNKIKLKSNTGAFLFEL